MSFWFVAIIIVIGGIEWLIVENFLDHVQEKLDAEDPEGAMMYIQKWHWLFQLDPLLHTHMHQLQQQIILSQQQDMLEDMA